MYNYIYIHVLIEYIYIVFHIYIYTHTYTYILHIIIFRKFPLSQDLKKQFRPGLKKLEFTKERKPLAGFQIPRSSLGHPQNKNGLFSRCQPFQHVFTKNVWDSTKTSWYFNQEFTDDTVSGRNPAPVDRWLTPFFYRSSTIQGGARFLPQNKKWWCNRQTLCFNLS